MKPTFQFNDNSRRDFSGVALRDSSVLPKTDFYFQPSAVTKGARCFNGCRHPSFRMISQGYFENEAGRNFVSEAAFFVVMVMTVTPAIVSSVVALAGLVRAYAAF
jgi:hypothetical protein